MRLPSKEAVGLTLFFVLLAGSLAVVLLAADKLPSGAFRLIRHIVTEMEAFVVFAGALAYGTEGGTMIAEAFLKKREKAGIEKGEKIGIEKGRRERDAKWRAWYEANREHLNGVTPPPFMRDSEEDTP